MENGSDTTTALVETLRNLPVQRLAGGHMIRGLENFTPGMLGLRPMELRISYDDETLGQIRLGRRLFPDGLDMVILKADPFRLLHEGTGKDRQAVCGSADGWVPLDELRRPKAPRCNKPLPSGDPTPVCEYARRDLDPITQKPTASKCAAGIVLMGLTAIPGEPPQPFWFPNTSISSVIPTRALLYEISTMSPDLSRFRVRVMTEKRKAPGGGRSYFPPLYVLGELWPDELFAAYREVAERVQAIRYAPFVMQELIDDDEVIDIDTTA